MRLIIIEPKNGWLVLNEFVIQTNIQEEKLSHLIDVKGLKNHFGYFMTVDSNNFGTKSDGEEVSE